MQQNVFRAGTIFNVFAWFSVQVFKARLLTSWPFLKRFVNKNLTDVLVNHPMDTTSKNLPKNAQIMMMLLCTKIDIA